MSSTDEGSRPSDRLSIAVIGTGPIGRAAGARWVAAGHDVAFGSRDPKAQASLASAVGSPVSVGTWAEAIAGADVVLLAVAYAGVPDVLKAVADQLVGKILIDATNPMGLDDAGRIVSTLPPGVTQGSWTAKRLPGARVIRAFSHVMDELLASRGRLQPLFWGMAVAGDDEEALQIACGLVRETGFRPVVIGGLLQSAPLDPGGPLFPHLYTPEDLRFAAAP